MNVAMPFSWLDSVTPTGTGSCPFAGESSAFFEPTEVGNYIDSVYLYDPLQNDSTLLILLGEGVAAGVSRDVVETNSLRINPNPCDRSAAISLSGEEIEEVTVQNILGERVFESQQEPSALFNLNTSALPSGIYFMEVRSRKGQYREHIIVSH
ncbi:MAG TPA: T9SS type A sorting domain-containing protein [Candidatus Kapabacteria bacterium]|nr:T9SS type A sorting domain-containing protein [Candidatus Kapabacteria bacterium]